MKKILFGGRSQWALLGLQLLFQLKSNEWLTPNPQPALSSFFEEMVFDILLLNAVKNFEMHFLLHEELGKVT